MFDGRLRPLVLLIVAVLALGASGYAATTGGVSIPGASHGFSKAGDRGDRNGEGENGGGDDQGENENGRGDDDDGDDGGRPTVTPPPWSNGHCGKRETKPPCKQSKNG